MPNPFRRFRPAGDLPADNRQMGRKLVLVVVLMFGFGYALVPMYRAICNALGINVLSVSELDGSGLFEGYRVRGESSPGESR